MIEKWNNFSIFISKNEAGSIFKMFLGVCDQLGDADGTCCSIILLDNPLIDFCWASWYISRSLLLQHLEWSLRGALEMVSALFYCTVFEQIFCGISSIVILFSRALNFLLVFACHLIQLHSYVLFNLPLFLMPTKGFTSGWDQHAWAWLREENTSLNFEEAHVLSRFVMEVNIANL